MAVLYCIISLNSFVHLELYRNDRKHAHREHNADYINFIGIANLDLMIVQTVGIS